MTEDGQPCEECATMERRLLIGAILAGVLLGAGAAIVILKQ